MKRREPVIDGLFAVDKPEGLTSHDVVDRVRRALHERRVGHAGTLDPDATGVLLIGVGQATKLLGRLTLDDKRYDARILLGQETDTDDAEGTVVGGAPAPERLADPGVAGAVVASMAGDGMQVPPAFSAVSVDGRRAYDRARAGEKVELEARPVTVFDAQLVGARLGEQPGTVEWDCSFTVSKGCYIRALARDLGRELGCGGHLTALRRTASGAVGLEGALTLDALADGGVDTARRALLDPVGLLGLPVRHLSEQEQLMAAQGKRLRWDGADGPVALVRDGRLYGLWNAERGTLTCDLNLVRGVEGVRRG